MKPDRGYRALAAKYIRRQAKQLAEQCRGIISADDPEYIHRARVATRRLRAALRLFRDFLGDRRCKRWRKALRDLAERLGEARDLDVQLELLEIAIAEQNDRRICTALAELAAHCRRRRMRLQPAVVHAVERFERSSVPAEMQSFTKKALRRLDVNHIDFASPYARSRTAKEICRALNAVLSLQDSLEDADDSGRQHEMRIAAKRLRYLLEIAQPVYQKRLGSVLEAVKQVQTYLGDIHDCDVWMELVQQHIERLRRRVVRAYRHEKPLAGFDFGFRWLSDKRSSERVNTLAALRRYWTSLKAQGVWEELARIVERATEVDATAEAEPQTRALVFQQTPAERLSENVATTSASPDAGMGEASSKQTGNGDRSASSRSGDSSVPPWPSRRSGAAGVRVLSR